MKAHEGTTFVWTGTGPGPGPRLDVRRDQSGIWRVTYGGFVWCEGSALAVALGEACGLRPDTVWVQATEQAILRRYSASSTALRRDAPSSVRKKR